MTRWIYNGTLMLTALFAILSGGQFPYTILLTLVTIRLFMAYVLKQNEKNLFMLYYTSKVVLTAGEPIDVEYKVTNTGLVPIAHAKIAFQFSEKIDAISPLKEIAFFKSYQMINFSKKLNCLYHGYYRVGKVIVNLYDPLLLSSKTLTFNKEVDVTVHPKIYPLSHFKVDANAFLGTFQSHFKDPTDRTSIANIRTYQHGDALKDIHWKISAKRHALHTKTFEQVLRQKCIIILDGYKGHTLEGVTINDEEMLTSFVTSLAYQLLEREIQTSLYVNGRCVEGNNAMHFSNHLEAMTGYNLRDDVKLQDNLMKIVFDEGDHQQYILATPQLKQGLLELLVNMKRRGINVTLFVQKPLKPQQNNLYQMLSDNEIEVTFMAQEVML